MNAIVIVTVFIYCVFHVKSNSVKENEKCCSPKQWSGQAEYNFVMDGDWAEEGIVNIVYDAHAEKVTRKVDGVKRSANAIKRYKIDVIQDFHERIEYVVEENQCRKIELRDFKEMCVPVSARTKCKGTYFGIFNSSHLDINTYKRKQREKNKEMYFDEQFTMTKDLCVPVLYIINGTIEGAIFMASVYFQEITPYVDQSVFSPQDICNDRQKTGELVRYHEDYQDTQNFTSFGSLISLGIPIQWYSSSSKPISCDQFSSPGKTEL